MPVVLSLLLFVVSFAVLLWSLRRGDRLSLGLPCAYLVALGLEHLPGAWAYWVTNGMSGSPAVERGIYLAAVGAACFALGVMVINAVVPVRPARAQGARRKGPMPPPGRAYAVPLDNGPKLWMFCLLGGWGLVYGISAFLRLPTIGAIVEKGGAIWMLGVMLGLTSALRRSDIVQGAAWFSALMVYPVLMLILGGFMSYGTAAVIITCSSLMVMARTYWKALGVLALCFVIAINIFVNYFAARNTIRDAVWGGASIDRRIDVVLDAASQAHFFSTKNFKDIEALDLRLNQNYFVGLASQRLEEGYVESLNGQSITDGLLSLVPRALWPEKPVYGGSPDIVRKMTGLNLNTNTSWGVGQVMEFYINFAMPGLIGGFLILGALMGWLDRMAAYKLRTKPDGSVFLYFLPGVALIQPVGSIVELTGGAGAALGGALIWKFVWNAFRERRKQQAQFNRLTAGYQ